LRVIRAGALVTFTSAFVLVAGAACGGSGSSSDDPMPIGLGETHSGSVQPSTINPDFTGDFDMHFYSFTAPEAGTFRAELSGDVHVQVTQCAPGDVGEYGCLCNTAVPTCCDVASAMCSFDLIGLASGQEVLLVVGTYGPDPASYILGVSGPVTE
jgi:hypothetical protein